MLLSFKIFDNTDQFRKEMLAQSLLLKVPISVKVIPQQTRAIITENHSIDIDHRNNDPKNTAV